MNRHVAFKTGRSPRWWLNQKSMTTPDPPFASREWVHGNQIPAIPRTRGPLPAKGSNALPAYVHGKKRQREREKSLTLKMRPLLAGEPSESPPRKWTHHSSTSTAAEAASKRATFAGAGTAISSLRRWEWDFGGRKPPRPGRLRNVNTDSRQSTPPCSSLWAAERTTKLTQQTRIWASASKQPHLYWALDSNGPKWF